MTGGNSHERAKKSLDNTKKASGKDQNTNMNKQPPASVQSKHNHIFINETSIDGKIWNSLIELPSINSATSLSTTMDVSESQDSVRQNDEDTCKQSDQQPSTYTHSMESIITTTQTPPSSPLMASRGESPRHPRVQPLISHTQEAQSTAQFTPNRSIIPIQNLEDFPMERLQAVQNYNFTKARPYSMWSHVENDTVIMVTANLENAPVDHICIKDERLITALGLRIQKDVISIQEQHLKIDETFIIFQSHLIGSDYYAGTLASARHAYLYWLDRRNTRYPLSGPFYSECIEIGKEIGRRGFKVYQEVNRYWDLEHGENRQEYRENRMRYLGENPCYEEGEERRIPLTELFRH